MDSNSAEKIHHHHRHYGGGGHHHHHHFFYVSPHCPHHRPILQPKNHSPSCYFSTSYTAAQNPEPAASINPPNPNLSFLDNQLNQSLHDSTMKQDEIEEVEEEEEEEEAIFVLTDEWRDFFAKSEAKRKLAKQAKKGKN
ncbi:hypothetical protein ACP275_04G229800 [Erythranthe tilingii]